MSVEWLHQSVGIIMNIGIVAAIVECASDSDQAGDSLRLLCSLAAASSIMRTAMHFLDKFL